MILESLILSLITKILIWIYEFSNIIEFQFKPLPKLLCYIFAFEFKFDFMIFIWMHFCIHDPTHNILALYLFTTGLLLLEITQYHRLRLLHSLIFCLLCILHPTLSPTLPLVELVPMYWLFVTKIYISLNNMIQSIFRILALTQKIIVSLSYNNLWHFYILLAYLTLHLFHDLNLCSMCILIININPNCTHCEFVTIQGTKYRHYTIAVIDSFDVMRKF